MDVRWDDDTLLRLYHQSIQRAHRRAVTMDDFVVTVRSHGLMPVECDWLIERDGESSDDEMDEEAEAEEIGMSHLHGEMLEKKYAEAREKLKQASEKYGTG